MKIANLIRTKRAAKRCSQLKLARLSGLSRYKIYLFENGYRKPTKCDLKKIESALLKVKYE